MALYTIADVKEFIKSNSIKNIELYQFNSTRKSVHTDFLKYVDEDINSLDDDTSVYYYEMMNFFDYTSSIEANCSNSFTEEEFDENYPDGLLVIVLDY